MASQQPSKSFQEETTDFYLYLVKFWDANSSVFMRWFLSLPTLGQISLLKEACPDLAYLDKTVKSSPSFLLAPELNFDSLLKDGGRGFLRLLCRRSSDTASAAAIREDLAKFKMLRRENRMPTFSGEAFDKVSLSFVDPTDPEEKVQSLLPSASPEQIEEKRRLIEQDVLIEADVWLTLQMRQHTLLAFLSNVAHTFETMFLKEQIQFDTPAIGCRTCGGKTRSDGKPLFRCPCNSVFYCSTEHQKDDWKFHKENCKKIRELNEIEK